MADTSLFQTQDQRHAGVGVASHNHHFADTGPGFSPTYDTKPVAAVPSRAVGTPTIHHSSHHQSSPATPSRVADPSQSTPGAVNSSHSGGNLYACRDCGRSYSRPEHLVRHVQTHTLGRRFACEICQKSFARKDLLRRHVSNHDDDPKKKKKRRRTSPGATRVSQACSSCATARVKCDDVKPCRRCVGRNLSCVWSDNTSFGGGNAHRLHPPARSQTILPDRRRQDDTPRDSKGPTFPSSSTPDASTLEPTATALQGTPVSVKSGQLPSPDVSIDQEGMKSLQTAQFTPSADLSGISDRPPFSDFLRDVLFEQALDPTKFDAMHGFTMLDFCDNANLEMTDTDFGMLNHWSVDGSGDSTTPLQNFTLQTDDSLDISHMRQNLVRVWSESPWRWDPTPYNSGYEEQGNLPVSEADIASVTFRERHSHVKRVTNEKLEPTIRDRILVIVLGTCRTNLARHRVTASFPSVELLDTLSQVFLASHACQVSGWIHFPTFQLNQQWPEWLAMAAAAGAVLAPVPALRKFGFALQEAVRISIPARFEENNTSIRDSGLVQALILWQDIGLWSGNRRKMEIAECHLMVPLTMMRYRRKFQRSSYPVIVVNPSDEGTILEEKWKLWTEQEHWKRLVFHCSLRDAQTSMMTLTNPAMSYAELTLPLPEARELWLAKTAQQWKYEYLQRGAGQNKRGPSVGDLFHNVHLLSANHSRLDVQFSISIFLHAFWALILEYRQLSAVHRSRSYTTSLGGTPSVLLDQRHQELVKDLQSFQLVATQWPGMTLQEHVLLNLLMLNLHVSLDDLQLFSGKEGEDQARRIYPILQQWALNSEARSALWCAGQVLRYAKEFPAGHLKDFYAVATHHAALALWTYGVVIRANRRLPPMQKPTDAPVYLDGSDSMAIQRFIGYGHGRPVVSGPAFHGAIECSLEDPRTCMDVAQDVLRSNFAHEPDNLPPIVENLCHLIKQLSDAACAVGLG